MRCLIYTALTALFLMPIVGLAETSESLTEINIARDGKAKISGARVSQVIGTSFYIRTNWGRSSARWLVRTNTNTKIIGKYDRLLSVSELQFDDLINIEGVMEGGIEIPNITASTVQSLSSQIQDKQYTGLVTAVYQSAQRLTLLTKESGTISIDVGTTTSIVKGSRTISFEEIQIGDRITKTQGLFDHIKKALAPSRLVIYIDMSIFKPKNFEGRLVLINNQTAVPTTMSLLVDTIEYQVAIDEKTEILNQKRKKASLKRFVADDTIRVYGAVQEDNLSLIKAELVRNLDL